MDRLRELARSRFEGYANFSDHPTVAQRFQVPNGTHLTNHLSLIHFKSSEEGGSALPSSISLDQEFYTTLDAETLRPKSPHYTAVVVPRSDLETISVAKADFLK